MEIIYFIAGIVIAVTICCLIFIPKVKRQVEKNTSVEEINRQLQEDQIKLLTDNKQIDKTIQELNQLIIQKQSEKSALEGQINAFQNNILKMQNQADETAQAYQSKAMEVMQERLDQSAQEASERYTNSIEEYKTEYFDILKELIEDFNSQINQKKEELAAVGEELTQLASKRTAAVAANIREEERKNKLTFYTIGLSELDKQEVERIRSILPYLRNGRPLNKAIWECYYRNLTTDMLNRIIGTEGQTGIYKITCLLDEKIYIGQAVNLKDRLTTHIKCGLGIDTPNNKLYTAMLKHGVENFTFEVIEKCTSKELNEKEKYWIAFYKSNEFGYNMSAGGSRSN